MLPKKTDKFNADDGKLLVYPAFAKYLDATVAQHISSERPRQKFPHRPDSFRSRDNFIQLYDFHIIAHPGEDFLQGISLQDTTIISVQL